MRSIKFYERHGHFLGRNGFFKASGVEVNSFEDTLILSPITTKGVVGRCQIHIPSEDIEQLIKELYAALPESVQEFFPVTSISRDDIELCIDPEDLKLLTDTDMRIIAEEMAKVYIGNYYWDHLESIAEAKIEEIKNGKTEEVQLS